MNKMIAIIMALTAFSQVSSAVQVGSGHYVGKTEQGVHCSMTIENYHDFVWMTLTMKSDFRVGDPDNDPIRVEAKDVHSDGKVVTYVGTNRNSTRYARAQVYLNENGSVSAVDMYKGKARIFGNAVRCIIGGYQSIRTGL